MQNAEKYLEKLESHSEPLGSDYTFEGVEVPDPIAGSMASDPRIEIYNVEEGSFGLDYGTMILDFTMVDCDGKKELEG